MNILIVSQFLLKIINLSQKNKNFNSETILIKNHKFESKINENVNVEYFFYQKPLIFYENHAATQRDAARRSATPTEDFATPTGDFATQRDAARRQEISIFHIVLMIC